jgi:uncharacterized protein DUF1835
VVQSVIHIVNGGSAAGTLQQALGIAPESNLLISHDLFSCGPLRPIETIKDWRVAREKWWAGVFADQGLEFLLGERTPLELVDHATELQKYDSVVTWIGTGLTDQLLLVFLVALFRTFDFPTSRLRVIQYDRVGHPDTGDVVISVGQLSPDQVRTHPEAISLQNDEIETISAAWAALTAPEPDRLTSFLSINETRLPFLSRSVRSLLRRYPDHRSGLGIWDRALLQHTIEEGPRAVDVIAATMFHDTVQPDRPGDLYLYSRLQRLGGLEITHPLVSFDEPKRSMRDTTVAVTDVGHAVLSGEANAVELNGIDDWVAGVHLDSNAGRVWFHREGELIRAG